MPYRDRLALDFFLHRLPNILPPCSGRPQAYSCRPSSPRCLLATYRSPMSPVPPMHLPRVLNQFFPQHWLCVFLVTRSATSEVPGLPLLCTSLPMPHTLSTGSLWQHLSLAHSLRSSLQRNRRAAGAGTGVGAGWGIRQSSGLLSESTGSQQQCPDGEVLAEGTVRGYDSLHLLCCLGALPQPAVHPRDASMTAGHKRECAGSSDCRV